MARLFQVVARYIQSALDIVLPRKERTIRIEHYRAENLPVHPEERGEHGAPITTLLQYRDTPTEDCIRALKYDKSAHAANLLADVLADYLREELVAIRSFSKKPIILVPIPLHKKRFAERGFNQVALVLERLPGAFKDGTLSIIALSIVERIRETSPQTHLNRADRLLNVQDAFAVSNPETARESHIILIDDVTTTGATLAEAAKPLEAIGASVTLIALSRA